MIPSFSNPQPFEPPNLTGGLVDTPHPGAVPANAAGVLINAEFRNQALMRRQGRVVVGQQCSAHPVCQGTIAYRPNTSAANDLSLYLNAQAAAGSSDTYLYSINSAFSIGAAGGVLPAVAADIIGSNATDERVGGFVQMNNYAFYWDGGDVRKKFIDLMRPHGNGDITDWGYQGSDLTAWTNGGTNAAGGKTDAKTYYGVWTLYNSTTGEETNPSAASASWLVSAPAQERDITIPITADWDASWDKIRIYSTFGDGAGVYYFEREVSVSVLLDSAPQLIPDGWSLSDSELGSEIEFDNHPPAQVLYLTVFDNRIFAVDALDPSSIVYSKDENPHAFPPVNKVYIDKDAGDLLGGLFVLGDGRLYAVNRLDGVFMITPSVGGTYAVEKVASGYGIVDHNSIIVVGSFAYWIDTKGIVIFDGHNITNISDPQIRQTFLRFKPHLFVDQADPGNPGDFTGCAGWHDKQADRLYLRWLVMDASEGIRYELIYDLTHEAWLLHRPGPEAVTAKTGQTDRTIGKVVRGETHEQYVVTGDDQGWHYQLTTVFKRNTVVWNDVDDGFLFRWRSPWYGTGKEDFLPLWIDFEYERSEPGETEINLTVEAYRDGNETPDQSETFQLYEFGNLRRREQMILHAKTCERFAVGFKCDGKDSDVKIMNIKLQGAEEGIKVLGT